MVLLGLSALTPSIDCCDDLVPLALSSEALLRLTVVEFLFVIDIASSAITRTTMISMITRILFLLFGITFDIVFSNGVW
jgi:hypothetical protein